MTDTEHPPGGLLAQMAAMAGVDPATEPADKARDILARARRARASFGGHPNPAWSTREQLAVALVLDDTEHLAGMGYTVLQAIEAVRECMYFPPADFTGWLAGIRDQLDHATEARRA